MNHQPFISLDRLGNWKGVCFPLLFTLFHLSVCHADQGTHVVTDTPPETGFNAFLKELKDKLIEKEDPKEIDVYYETLATIYSHPQISSTERSSLQEISAQLALWQDYLHHLKNEHHYHALQAIEALDKRSWQLNLFPRSRIIEKKTQIIALRGDGTITSLMASYPDIEDIPKLITETKHLAYSSHFSISREGLKLYARAKDYQRVQEKIKEGKGRVALMMLDSMDLSSDLRAWETPIKAELVHEAITAVLPAKYHKDIKGLKGGEKFHLVAKNCGENQDWETLYECLLFSQDVSRMRGEFSTLDDELTDKNIKCVEFLITAIRLEEIKSYGAACTYYNYALRDHGNFGIHEAALEAIGRIQKEHGDSLPKHLK